MKFCIIIIWSVDLYLDVLAGNDPHLIPNVHILVDVVCVLVGVIHELLSHCPHLLDKYLVCKVNLTVNFFFGWLFRFVKDVEEHPVASILRSTAPQFGQLVAR